MTITFIGHGYVGLVTAAVFADLGNTVYVIGHTQEKVENLKKGILPIYEPGLEELVKRNVVAGRLIFTLDYTPAIPESEVVFIAVGTPPLEDGSADLSVVFEVAKKAGEHLANHTVITVKSTVPVGTNKRVQQIVQEVKPEQAEFDIASVPEFLREGQAIGDTQHPDRIVIGTENKKAQEKMVTLHDGLIKNSQKDTHLVLTTVETAEMIKYAANAFLATKISYANMIAHLSEVVGADGVAVLEAIGLDQRIGKSFLNAGSGYGGSCFPKDVKALIKIAEKNNVDLKLIKEVEAINQRAIHAIVEKAKKLLGSVEGKTIGIWGLAFKPDTDDMRDAPSRVIIHALASEGAMIKAFDPIAQENAKELLKGDATVSFGTDAYAVAEDADLVILVTEWNEFKEIDLNRVAKSMRSPAFIDGRNVYTPSIMKELGFTYLGVGRA